MNLRVSREEAHMLLLWSKIAMDQAAETGVPFEAVELALRRKIGKALGLSEEELRSREARG